MYLYTTNKDNTHDELGQVLVSIVVHLLVLHQFEDGYEFFYIVNDRVFQARNDLM
jgi:hypothetical protein